MKTGPSHATDVRCGHCRAHVLLAERRARDWSSMYELIQTVIGPPLGPPPATLRQRARSRVRPAEREAL